MSTIQVIAGASWVVATNPAGETIEGTSVADNIMGGDGPDVLLGYDDNDNLIGGAGNDWMSGDAGNDWLAGGAGNDWMYGGSGNDFLSGGIGDAGNDRLYGGTGNDQLYGREGNDILVGADSLTWGSQDFDLLEGGAGTDTFVLGNNSYTYYEGAGYATITDFSSADDYIQAYGLSTGNWSGTSASDTGIFFENDLIAVVQDTVDVEFTRDFNFVGIF